MTPKITIGMATFNDFEGVWATVQSVFLHNDWESPNDVEIVIVDTSPKGSEHRRLVQDFVKKGGGQEKGSRTENIKYVDMSGYAGTTLPRDEIFRHATGTVVCVMDCHVMLPSNKLLQLQQWFEKNPDCKDLIHGPIVYDNLHTLNTQFSDQFRGGMWGTWSTHWKAPTGEVFVCEGEEVSDTAGPRKSDGLVHYHDPMTMEEILPPASLPENIPWVGHNQRLEKLGCVELGRPDTEEPFEICAMGMGLFACRKDAWLGFAKNCSGFGGEEMNIHIKYRQAGRKVICLPFLKWNHRFGRAGGAPYPIPLAAKVRNYVLWANELNIPLTRIYKHFVEGGSFSAAKWNELVRDPVNYNVNLDLPKRTEGHPLDILFAQTAKNARDLNEHAESIRDLVMKTQSVVAFVKRTDWEPIIASGFPSYIEVYQSEHNDLTQYTHDAVKIAASKDNRIIHKYQTHKVEKDGDSVDPLDIESIPNVDLLIVDKTNEAKYIQSVLNKHGNKAKFILIRGTESFGEVAEGNNEPGLFYGIRNWLEENEGWFVLKHEKKQYGYTVLCNIPSLRPEKEVRPWPIGHGPGTELKLILSSIGINPGPTCDCKTRMRQMDEWGIQGCKENFDTIVGWLKENAERWGWNKVVASSAEEHLSLSDKIKIGWKSLTTGLAFKLDWLDPYPGLVKEAIRKAEENKKCSKNCKKEGCDKGGCQKKG